MPVYNAVTTLFMFFFKFQIALLFGSCLVHNWKSNENLRDGGFGLSWGLVQNPFIPFQSEFLVSLTDEEASLSHNLKQFPAV